MNRLFSCAIGCLVGVSTASVADAQLVRVGPFGGVSVRAPFVSVDTLPFGGGTRVRAPFVSINTRAYAYGYGYGYRPYGPVYYGHGFYDHGVPSYPVPVYSQPLYPEVVYPTPHPVYPQTANSIATSAALPERLRASALQLKRSLSVRRDDSDVWLDYLAPDRIVQTIDGGAAPASLSDLLLNYVGVTGNPTLSSIRGASGFGETYRLLQAFISSQADSGAPQSSQETNDSNANSILVPEPVPTTDLNTKEPTRAAPVQPAGDGDTAEELPLPPPAPTPL